MIAHAFPRQVYWMKTQWDKRLKSFSSCNTSILKFQNNVRYSFVYYQITSLDSQKNVIYFAQNILNERTAINIVNATERRVTPI